nr:class 1 fructose-bisphosphatase [Saprospiraceae bacterium]
MSKIITLDEFIIQRQKDFPFSTGELSGLLRDIGVAAKIINREVNKAGLVDILGITDRQNIQGEEVRKLDEFADETLINCLKNSGQACGYASEEQDDFKVIPTHETANAKYAVLFDPLDGSSNIDVNVSIGTIFAIYRRTSEEGPCRLDDFLQKGSDLVAAGYIIYGSSTMLVYTTGKGVNGFTLDPSIGEFCLSHPNIRIPENGNLFSVNVGNFSKFPESVKDYIRYCMGEEDGKKPFSLRYIGSFVADFHRNLIKGGIFMYPPTLDRPEGKLRLLYECNPLAFIVEQAGGRSSDGFVRTLDEAPKALHQRVPLFIGSANMVKMAEEYCQ